MSGVRTAVIGAVAAAIVVILAGCEPPKTSPSSVPSGSSPSAAVQAPTPTPSFLAIAEWGDVWTSLPGWFELPKDATILPASDQTVSFTTALKPAAAIAFFDHVLGPLEFSAESRDRGADFEQAYFNWGRSDSCELLVVAHAIETGSRVDIRYPWTCPR